MPKAEVEFVGPYDNDVCHFCGAKLAAYQRLEKGKKYDACEKCAREFKPEKAA
jgi:hypothetical protein